MELKDLESNFF